MYRSSAARSLDRARCRSTRSTYADHFSVFLPINLQLPCDVTCTTARQRVVSDDALATAAKTVLAASRRGRDVESRV
jgi:hypothetical protein